MFNMNIWLLQCVLEQCNCWGIMSGCDWSGEEEERKITLQKLTAFVRKVGLGALNEGNHRRQGQKAEVSLTCEVSRAPFLLECPLYFCWVLSVNYLKRTETSSDT